MKKSSRDLKPTKDAKGGGTKRKLPSRPLPPDPPKTPDPAGPIPIPYPIV